MFQRDSEFIDQPCDERELLCGADGPADADGVVRRGLTPRVDVFKRFSEVKILKRVVHDDLESWARKLAQITLGEARGVVDEVCVEGGIIPPVGGDVAEFAWHE